MKYTSFLIIMLLIVLPVLSQVQTVSYDGIAYSETKTPVQHARVGVRVSILSESETGEALFTETHSVTTDSNGNYHIEIGSGNPVEGKFESLIWSVGTYFIRTETDPNGGNNYRITHTALMRIPTELTNDYEQGTDSAKETAGWGVFRFINTRHKRPKKVTVDLTSSYVNLAYPADTYPIYRHYEWCDVDRDGVGNAFIVTFSEHTNNAFIENTVKMGEVSLYPIPFQELLISSTNSEITISLTKPVTVINHSQTYAIKGPWKFIYFIEW